MSSSQAPAREKKGGKQKANARPVTIQGARFDDKPLWNHVKVLSVEGGGGNRTWCCNYCGKRVVGSYTKVKGHLLKLPKHGVEGCLVISDEVFEAIKKEHVQAESRKAQQELNARKKAEYVSLPQGSDLAHHKKRKGGDQFDIEGREVIELTELSLDEPVLEGVRFDEDDDVAVLNGGLEQGVTKGRTTNFKDDSLVDVDSNSPRFLVGF
ncbi:hypothetical protein Vadar_012041 [Vaccinium darrowii]|uniref:Uncharacterized protein n=1 Tax=Vaccinium darrowii TaxID=229202 RepID=A0ACB7Y6E2_9ERIC|nr:hypothetical protein Vadar_012041 [Vaccinium darrowii]